MNRSTLCRRAVEFRCQAGQRLGLKVPWEVADPMSAGRAQMRIHPTSLFSRVPVGGRGSND